MSLLSSVNIFALIFLVTLTGGHTTYPLNEIIVGVSTNDLLFKLGSNSSFSVTLNQASAVPIWVNFSYDNPDVFELLESDEWFDANQTSLQYIVRAKQAGKGIIHVHAFAEDNHTNVSCSNVFVRISVQHSSALNDISAVIGWMYFIAWSISFYPQTISNFRRKSVVGLNFDFLGLNITGFLFYSIFNIGFFFIRSVQDEYLGQNPTSIIPVEVNDVVFALHATLATLIQITQCIFYERGDQQITLVARGLLGIFWSGGFVFLVVTIAGANQHYPWLTFIYYFSYVKLGITLIKYMPQAYFNFKRKSTEGWSIGNILLDFTGGILSMIQMIIIAYNFNDWNSLFGNFTKFGLGMFSVLFDILFMVQHYGLYRAPSSPSTQNLLVKP